MLRRFMTIVPAVLMAGCAVLKGPPGPVGLEERFAALGTHALPLAEPVTIRWNERMIPFIEAATDADAAFALGYVHAHLRLGMMAVMRRAAQGRMSESAGPFTVEIDAAIRAFDFGRATKRIHAAMPQESRAWLARYAEGVNAYAARLGPDAWPHEFGAMAIDWEPWRPEDSLLIGRLTGIDINWLVLFVLMGEEDEDLRVRVLAELLHRSGSNAPSFGGGGEAWAGLAPLEKMAELGLMVGKSGSNSVVIAGARSASGAALIASDPHLGFFIPNPWLIAGLRSPSYNMVGMMVPGTPVFAFGRNRDIAWGGTNLRATTSEFVDVSGLDAGAFRTRRHEIGVRLWFDETVETRESPHGPVMSDASALPRIGRAFAVRWVGHELSDEITALLGAMRARSFEEFRTAMVDFAIPPQTFLVAERDGGIAGMIATKVPQREADVPPGLLSPPDVAEDRWRELWSGVDLPFVRDPEDGFLAAANNRPIADETRPYGGFFPPDERVRRLQALLAGADGVAAPDLMRLQMDTVSGLMLELLAAARPALEAWKPRSPDEAEAIRLLLDWDGDYAVESRGAPVAEAFMLRFVPLAWEALGEAREGALFARMSRDRAYLLDRLGRLDDAGWRTALGPALEGAAAMSARRLVWGELHRIDVGHVLQRVPLGFIADRYRIGTMPVPGSVQTVFKTSHEPTDEEHRTTFGAQARHVSDLGDPDANWFVLFGGQDGWIGSPAFADQVPLWARGDLVRLPMRPETVAAEYPIVTVLTPD